MQTPRRALRSSWVTWLLCAYSVTVTALLFVSAHQNVISKSAAPMPSVPVMPVTGTVRIPMRVPVPVPTAPLLVSLQTKTPKVLGNSRRENERHLIVSHYKENLTWLNTGWGADFSHSVYEMGRVPGVVPDFSDSFVQDMGNGRYALLNFADEGSGYLRFILDNYDHLPDVMAFLHGKPQAHNPVISQWVGCLRDDVGDTPHFVFLTKRFVENRCIIDWEGNSMLKRIKIGPRAGEEIDYGAFVAYWKGFPWKLLNSTLDAPPTCVTFHCCAEFALTRAMVRSRPRSFYATLWAHMLDFILDEQNAKKYHGMQVRAAGGIFEHIWHMIFHEPVHMQRTTNSKYCAIMKPDCGACLDEIE
eukprot:TRINITY_DN473_c3_g1_i2.p1 TRINITY_DN473_c3_g1~~TRINITY_DN473_c3_g1_i2.p1  ORF type:complete len:359 (+),score=41.27 TRINITY_DN473_c3_g1_i2:771-1847(+)